MRSNPAVAVFSSSITVNLPFQEKMKAKAKTKLSHSKGKEIIFERLCIRHGGVIGLCAFVSAFPYDIPDYVPDLLSLLGSHLNDYHPIPVSIVSMSEYL